MTTIAEILNALGDAVRQWRCDLEHAQGEVLLCEGIGNYPADLREVKQLPIGNGEDGSSIYSPAPIDRDWGVELDRLVGEHCGMQVADIRLKLVRNASGHIADDFKAHYDRLRDAAKRYSRSVLDAMDERPGRDEVERLWQLASGEDPYLNHLRHEHGATHALEFEEYLQGLEMEVGEQRPPVDGQTANELGSASWLRPMSIKEIARWASGIVGGHGINERTVRRWRERAGVAPGHRGQRFTRELTLKIIRQGASQNLQIKAWLDGRDAS